MPAAPAAKLDDKIQLAIADLERSITEATQDDDPLRYPMLALVSLLRAQQQLYAETARKFGDRIEVAQRPLADEEIRKLSQAAAAGAQRHAIELVRAAKWKVILMGVLLFLLFAGGVGGFLFQGGTPVMVGLRAGTEECGEWLNNYRLCKIPVWERRPAGLRPGP